MVGECVRFLFTSCEGLLYECKNECTKIRIYDTGHECLLYDFTWSFYVISKIVLNLSLISVS